MANRRRTSFRIEVARSFAPYVWDCLEEARREFLPLTQLPRHCERSEAIPEGIAQSPPGLLRCARNDSLWQKTQAPEETMDFNGKVALITGAGNGIGRATALGFARDGAKVVVVDRDTAGGEGTAGIIRQQGGEALFVDADVTRSADVQAYVKAALDAYGDDRLLPQQCRHRGQRRRHGGIRRSDVRHGDGRQRQRNSPRSAACAAGDAEAEARRDREHRLGCRLGRIARHAGLCCLQACGDRAHQDGGRRGGATGRSRQRGLPRTYRHADDTLAGSRR